MEEYRFLMTWGTNLYHGQSCLGGQWKKRPCTWCRRSPNTQFSEKSIPGSIVYTSLPPTATTRLILTAHVTSVGGGGDSETCLYLILALICAVGRTLKKFKTQASLS